MDFCAYWFRLAHDQLEETGRAGLVATNSISQGKSRAASLEYVTQNGGLIHDAISSQVWSGEANVHVSIVNWMKPVSPRLSSERLPSSPALLPGGEGGKKEEKMDDGLSEVVGRGREIPAELLERARMLRKKQTPAEGILWECLRDRRFLNAKFRRQHNIGSFIADFYCHAARLVVEADGEIHQSQTIEDANRNEWMESQGLTVLRFTNQQILDDLDTVLSTIAQIINPQKPARLPSPSGRRVGDEGNPSSASPNIPCYLDNTPVPYINSSLKSQTDVSQAARLSANLNRCFQGVIPVGKGFIITEAQVNNWIKADPKNQEVLKLFSMGANLAQEVNGKPDRWIIDFSNMPLEDVSDYKLPFEHIKTYVKPERELNREAVMREKWWRFKRTNEGMRKAIAPLSHYFAVPEVSKWAIFVACPINWLPGNKTKAVVSDDFYVFGILTSNIHRTWMHAQKSTLKADIAYTHNTCFETFPFPQTPTPKHIDAIRQTALDLHEYRSQQMEKKQWGITKLYNEYFHEPTSQLAKLHAKLDDLVLQAYGFKPDDDLLEKLLTLNLDLAEQEKQGIPIIGPWAPDNPPQR